MSKVERPRVVSLVMPWLLAAAAGIALALALPGLCWWPLLLVFPGLLLESLHRAGGRWRSLLLGWWAGMACWFVSTSWVYPVMHDYGGLPALAAAICLVLMAVYLGFSWAIVSWFTCLASPRLRVWMLPLAWSAVEAWRQLPFYIFPWNPTAAALAPMPAALQSLPVWGATGLGWAVAAIGCGLWALCRRETRRQGLASIAAALVLLVLCSLLAPKAVPTGDPLVVAALQPGTTLEQTWDPDAAGEIAEQVWQLSRETASGRPAPDLILWPESAVPHILERDPVFTAELVALSRELDSAIVVSSIGFTQEGGYTNAAYLVDRHGEIAPRYDKVRLVPFGEYVPVIASFAFAKSLVKQVAGFTPGDAPRPLQGEVPIGMAICYEAVFADLIAEEVRRGAQLLTTITNDGWYGFSWAPEQHFQQVVLRAAESRRWLVRAALTGVSGVIDPYGRVVERLDVGRSGFVKATVQPTCGLTPRARWGDWWGVLCGIGALLMVIVERSRKRR